MRLVKCSQITSVLLGFVFASFGYLSPSRAANLPIQQLGDTNGLISLWQFEEGEGIIAYDSFGGNDGTIFGAGWTSGMIGGALSFDGVDDYVDVGNDNSLKPPLPVTLSAWVNLSSSGSTQYIVGIDDQTYNYYGIWWYVRSADNLGICYGDGDGPGPASRRSKVGTTGLNADTWYHIAAVVEGPADMNLYVNGIDDGGTYSGTGGSLAYSSASSSIGAIMLWPGDTFGGKIDDVRVYERALSEQEILGLYGTGVGVPVIGIWPESVDFYADEGGPNPASQTISIFNAGVGILNWEITEGCSWLNIEPNVGYSTGEIDEATLSVDVTGLSIGHYVCEVLMLDANAINSPRTAMVNLFVGPVIEFAPSQFLLETYEGGPNPQDQILRIWNGGLGTLNWQISYDCNWLQAEPNTGSCSGEVTEVIISADTTEMLSGEYYCELIVSDPCAANNYQVVDVKLVVEFECFPGDHPEYGAWVDVGKPECWCYPRQCHGDADGLPYGLGGYWVSIPDLTILKNAWGKYLEQMVGNEICADFDHLPYGLSGYRVSIPDLYILRAYWGTASVDPDCPGNLNP